MLLESKDFRVAWGRDCSDQPAAYFSEFKSFTSEGTLRSCAELGIPIYHLWVAYEAFLGRIPVQWLSKRVALLFEPPAFYMGIKRILDIFFVLVSAPLVLPLGLLVALLIKLDSPGPVLFVQTRVGKDGRPFLIYKFRTMLVDVKGEAAKFATEEGDRMTRIGRILRKFRIDEVPQFWNVLKGEMSLIGPRPELVPFAQRFNKTIPYYFYRHRVRPGITGWAQVMQGYAASEEETRAKLEFDLFYVKNISFSLDYLIFLKTIKTVLTGFGAK
ncbi:MAG: sugar transferase [Gammaproteobacteria bacterium]|nr:sugar transferase [Gammaproteobacteria bacterium]